MPYFCYGLILGGRTDIQSRRAISTMLAFFPPVHALWFTFAQSSGWLAVARWFRAYP